MTIYFSQVQIGGYDHNFNYFIGDAQTKKVAVVDPDNLPLLETIIAEKELDVVAILLTHSHFDHVAGCKELSELTGATIYMHRNNPVQDQIKHWHTKLLSDGDKIEVGGVTLQAIETLGHTQDSICYYLPPEEGGPKLITGDTLFIDGCGRCDLAGGDPQQMYRSLYEKISVLPPQTEIYPGHDYGKTPFDTLEKQKLTNKYLSCASIEEFVKLRM